jgi:hypothetical protein
MECSEAVSDVLAVTRDRHSKKQRITVRFSSKAVRDKVLTCRRRMGEMHAKDVNCEGDKIYVNEKLTPHNRHLLWLAKSARTLGYKYIWSKNGTVYMKKQEGSEVIIIREVDDIPCR